MLTQFGQTCFALVYPIESAHADERPLPAVDCVGRKRVLYGAQRLAYDGHGQHVRQNIPHLDVWGIARARGGRHCGRLPATHTSHDRDINIVGDDLCGVISLKLFPET